MLEGITMRSFLLIVATTICFVSTGCGAKPQVATAPDYAPSSTIKDIMDSIVDPNADILWGAVSTTITAKGSETKMPKTDDEWKEVRRHAITLYEATNLLMIPNRHVAKPGEKADSPDVEEAPEAIEAHINGDRATFENRIHGLRDAATGMLAAIDARDTEAMDAQGEKLDSACESCHLVYWYPRDEQARRLYELSQRDQAGATGK
jgi:hypothetical protein